MSDVHPDLLRSERENASVLKVDLARLRERHKCRMVIVLEGKDDLPVYEAWIKRLDESLEWEPLIAKGKAKALEFLDLLRRDKTGLATCTYVVVDHDYDGLRGRSGGEDVFVLPAYSVENYLVHESVLDSYLRTELRIVGTPDVRASVVKLYIDVRARFIEFIKPPCKVLFGAKNEAVGNIRVGQVRSVIELVDGTISVRRDASVEDLVTTQAPVSNGGLQAGERFLVEGDPVLRVRGKFLLDFFKEFCEILYQDRKSESPLLFDERAQDNSLSAASLDLRNLASKSPMPEGLGRVLAGWERDCRDRCAA